MPNAFAERKNNWALLLALVTAAIGLFLTLRYANQPLLEAHDFRQTQTALSAYWMQAEGWKFAYETPVVGYPWSIPFEFPIYQSIVVGVSSLFKIPLDACGRIVSMAFLLAVVWPVRRIVRHFGWKDELAWVFCALLWSAPLYIFWGRSFMIETTGLFFTLAALSFLVPLHAPKPSVKTAALACLFGTLALLQKVTTALPAMAVVGVWTLYAYLKQQPRWQASRVKFFCLLLSYGIPLLFMQLWTSYSDAVKSQNEFGRTLTASSLLLWNFGTVKQRLSLANNFEIFGIRILHHNLASLLGAAVIGGALLLGKSGVRKPVAFCLLLGILPVSIFYNLHLSHTYYQAACTVFFIAALAIGGVLWLPLVLKRKWTVLVFVLFCVGINYTFFFTRSYGRFLRKPFSSATDTTLAISQIIRQNTSPASALIVFGYDWSSTVAYHSQRKSLTVPDWWCGETHFWQKASFTMGDRKVGAVVCFPNTCVGIAQLLQKPEIKSKPVIFSLYDAYLWLPNATVVHDPISNRNVYPLPLDSLYRLALDTVPFSHYRNLANIHR